MCRLTAQVSHHGQPALVLGESVHLQAGAHLLQDVVHDRHAHLVELVEGRAHQREGLDVPEGHVAHRGEAFDHQGAGGNVHGRDGRRGSWSSCSGGGGSSSSTNLLAPSLVKKEFLLSSPKILRLRARFGLDPTPTELVFLPRGPNFLNPTSSLSRHAVGGGSGTAAAAAAAATGGAVAAGGNGELVSEMETLLAEKAQLDAQRAGERARLARAQETSFKAIQGIGVVKRRTNTATTGAEARAGTNAEEKSTSVPAALPPISPAAAGVVDLSALQSAAAGSRSNRSSIGSVAQPALTSRRASSTTALATAADGTLSLAAAVPSAVASAVIGSPSGASPPRYRSSFFAAPAIHASDAVHERVGGQGPPPPHPALVRRYTDRRKTASMGSVSLAPEDVAAAVATTNVAVASLPDAVSAAPTRTDETAAVAPVEQHSGAEVPVASAAPTVPPVEPASPPMSAVTAAVARSPSPATDPPLPAAAAAAPIPAAPGPSSSSAEDADLSLELSADDLADLDDP